MAKHFTINEFACKHCGQIKIDSAFLQLLDNARDIAGIPFHITSGYRCFEHNRAIKSQDTSSHVKGLAVDIRCASSRERFKILYGLLKSGFSRIGIGETFIHADFDEEKTQKVIWLYN